VTDREILDALHNIRELCIPGVNWTDDLARLTLAEFDRAAIEIGKIIAAREALLAACEGERRELAADQPSSLRSAWAKDIYRQRLARLDAAIALAHEGQPTRDRSTS
jgi:hypothetical protein